MEWLHLGESSHEAKDEALRFDAGNYEKGNVAVVYGWAEQPGGIRTFASANREDRTI